MKLFQCKATDQIFSVIVTGETKLRHYNTSAMERFVRQFPLSDDFENIEFDMDQQTFDLFYENRGIEQHRLLRIQARQALLDDPILCISELDSTTLTVDGHHRYCARWMIGLRVCRAHLFTYEAANRFLIEDMPDPNSPKHLTGFSGIF